MARVRAIHLSPIKSLGLMSSERATVTPDGIAGDRAFVLLDDRGEVATMRRYGALARAGSRFDPDTGRLVVVLPDGSEVSGIVGGDEREAVLMFGRDVQGTIVEGPWAEALSELAGSPMRLMRVGNGHAQDTYPMSLLSEASLHELARAVGRSRGRRSATVPKHAAGGRHRTARGGRVDRAATCGRARWCCASPSATHAAP